jgi:hypothetical protein
VPTGRTPFSESNSACVLDEPGRHRGKIIVLAIPPLADPKNRQRESLPEMPLSARLSRWLFRSSGIALERKPRAEPILQGRMHRYVDVGKFENRLRISLRQAQNRQPSEGTLECWLIGRRRFRRSLELFRLADWSMSPRPTGEGPAEEFVARYTAGVLCQYANPTEIASKRIIRCGSDCHFFRLAGRQ